MNKDIFFGTTIIGIVLILITYLTLLAKNRIDKIKKSGPNIARKIIKDMHDGK